VSNDLFKKGFTLIELLVVISIIPLLSSVVLSSLSGAREQAKITAAKSELDNIWRAVERLKTDTGTLPGGCPTGAKESNIFMFLYEPEAGLTQKPSAGEVTGYFPGGGSCEWTTEEVSSWSGPYISKSELEDPWENPHIIDTSYIINPAPPDPSNCPEEEMNSQYVGRGPKIYSQGV
jgi:prepilin-type N-terminal cleavage/methylation domain-containing protein